MADMHVLAGDGVGAWTLVCHYAVPNTNNAVGVNHRTALIASGISGTSAMIEGTGPGQISTAELALLVAGELYEYSIAFLAESGATTNSEMLVSARAAYASEEARLWAELQRKLKYYGYTGSKA